MATCCHKRCAPMAAGAVAMLGAAGGLSRPSRALKAAGTAAVARHWSMFLTLLLSMLAPARACGGNGQKACLPMVPLVDSGLTGDYGRKLGCKVGLGQDQRGFCQNQQFFKDRQASETEWGWEECGKCDTPAYDECYGKLICVGFETGEVRCMDPAFILARPDLFFVHDSIDEVEATAMNIRAENFTIVNKFCQLHKAANYRRMRVAMAAVTSILASEDPSKTGDGRLLAVESKKVAAAVLPLLETAPIISSGSRTAGTGKTDTTTSVAPSGTGIAGTGKTDTTTSVAPSGTGIAGTGTNTIGTAGTNKTGVITESSATTLSMPVAVLAVLAMISMLPANM